jgi:hypothetical protein
MECLTVLTYRARARVTPSAVTTRWFVAEITLIPDARWPASSAWSPPAGESPAGPSQELAPAPGHSKERVPLLPPSRPGQRASPSSQASFPSQG